MVVLVRLTSLYPCLCASSWACTLRDTCVSEQGPPMMTGQEDPHSPCATMTCSSAIGAEAERQPHAIMGHTDRLCVEAVLVRSDVADHDFIVIQTDGDSLLLPWPGHPALLRTTAPLASSLVDLGEG